MARTPYKPITEDQRHGVATLHAAGLRPSTISLKLAISKHLLERIMAEDTWPALLESKRAAIRELMAGRDAA